MTVTMPEDLKRLIKNYNTRNPFNRIVVSQVARKVIFEFIKTNDPELANQESQAIECKRIEQEIPEVTEEQGSEDSFLETSADTSEFIQEVVQDFQDADVLLTEGKEFTCERCSALFKSKTQMHVFALLSS